jgi:hypothetical protein
LQAIILSGDDRLADIKFFWRQRVISPAAKQTAALVKLAYAASPRLRFHPKHRLPADTPVAQLVGDPRNVAPVPLRPGLRRQRLVRDQRHQQCKIRRKLLLRPELNEKKLCKRAFCPPPKSAKLMLVVSPEELPNTTTTPLASTACNAVASDAPPADSRISPNRPCACSMPTTTLVAPNSRTRPHHLERKAILYVRQSSVHQVLHNRESSALQYAMRDRLTALGWSQIDTVDDDLGRSAAGGTTRACFERMVVEVCLGKVGAVPARGVSRFARNSRD